MFLSLDLGVDPEEAEECRLTQTQTQRPSQSQFPASAKPIAASSSSSSAAVAAAPSSAPVDGMIPLARLAFNRVHVLPSLGRGQVVGISKTIPPSDIKMFQSYRSYCSSFSSSRPRLLFLGSLS